MHKKKKNVKEGMRTFKFGDGNKLNTLYKVFIIQCVKARAITCPHQPPTRGDITVSVAQGGTATPGATKQ